MVHRILYFIIFSFLFSSQLTHAQSSNCVLTHELASKILRANGTFIVWSDETWCKSKASANRAIVIEETTKESYIWDLELGLMGIPLSLATPPPSKAFSSKISRPVEGFDNPLTYFYRDLTPTLVDQSTLIGRLFDALKNHSPTTVAKIHVADDNAYFTGPAGTWFFSSKVNYEVFINEVVDSSQFNSTWVLNIIRQSSILRQSNRWTHAAKINNKYFAATAMHCFCPPDSFLIELNEPAEIEKGLADYWKRLQIIGPRINPNSILKTLLDAIFYRDIESRNRLTEELLYFGPPLLLLKK